MASVGAWVSLLWPATAQQSFVFPLNGKNYRVEVSWSVKHAGTVYTNASAHTLDFSKANAFDLEVQFRFPDEAPPPESGLLWGFQYRHAGSMLAPTDGEKRARSVRQFQRFQAVGSGNATLTLTAKVWRRTSEGEAELLASGQPTTLGFARAAAATTTVSASPSPSDTAKTLPSPPPPATLPSALPLTPAAKAESEAYTKAASEPDSAQRIKALIDFVERHQMDYKQSPIVQKAMREIPLSTSLPQPKGRTEVTYLLNYAVKPSVDTNKSQQWSWALKNIGPGKFELTVRPLTDTARTLTLADEGKAPPFNRPRTLQPFEKVQVTLLSQTREDFTLRLSGGSPPFVAFLSQDHITRIRYYLPHTDTTWTLSKALCTVCKGGAHTLEVYTGDFSTLLLREIDGVYIHRFNYVLWMLAPSVALLLLLVFRKPIAKGWKTYQYQRKLRDIEAWERLIEQENQRRKGQK
mgnify:CR=1 FL=1